MSEPKAVIAIVDDESVVRRGIISLLKSLGFAAIDFASAEEFLSSGRTKDISCLITDVWMPGMSGIDLLHQLITDGHSVPVIIMTAFPEERIRTRAIKAGAVSLLTKPFDQETLLDCVNLALHRS